jgi:hypothetical protein
MYGKRARSDEALYEVGSAMFAKGQKLLRDLIKGVSALTPKAAAKAVSGRVRLGPIADIRKEKDRPKSVSP